MPANINKFLFDYKNSKFIECNRPLAEYNSNFFKIENSTEKYVQKKDKNEIIIKHLNYTISKLEMMSKRYWLAGGTLLGELILLKIDIGEKTINISN